MTAYAEFTHWSPTLGCDATRLSLTDEGGSEYYAVLPRTEGRAWREAKREALDHIAHAIELGLEPGEVRWR